MGKPKIYIHRAGPWYSRFMDKKNEAALASFAEIVTERDRTAPLSSEEVFQRLQGCSAILSLNGEGAGEITARVVRSVGCIRVICIAHYWGWGHFTDVTAEMDVPVIEGSNAGTLAVAEWNVAAALMGVRRLHHFDRTLKRGSGWGHARREVRLLAGSVAGLVGLGRIGQYTARYLKALGVHVIAYSKSCSREKAEELGVKLVTLQYLLSTSDLIVLNQRVTKETHGMLGRREFAMIKAGCVFINSARAALYDESALVEELKTGRFTAFIDVFSTEPLALNHPFRSMSNVVLTPHIAGNNSEMFLRCARESIETLRAFFDEGKLVDSRYRYP